MRLTKIGTVWCIAERPFCRECIGPECGSCVFEEEPDFDTVIIIKQSCIIQPTNCRFRLRMNNGGHSCRIASVWCNDDFHFPGDCPLKEVKK